MSFSSNFASKTAVSPDVKYLALPRDEETAIYAVDKGQRLRSLPVPGQMAVFTPSGHHLVVIDGNLCRVFSTKDWSESHAFQGSPIGKLPGHRPNVSDIVFVPHTSWMFARSADSDSRIWDLDSGMLIQTIEGQKGLHAAEASADGQWLVTSEMQNNVARLYRRMAGWETVRFDAPREGPFPILSPDGELVLSWIRGATASLWQLDSSSSVPLLGSCGERVAPVFSPDGSRVAMASADRQVFVWTTAPVARLNQHRFAHEPELLAFSPDGKRLGIITADGSAHIGDGESAPTRQVKLVDQYAICCAFDSDNQWFAVSDDTKVKVWDISGEKLLTDFDHPHQVRSIAFTDDGRELAVALFDGQVYLWDIGKRQLIQRLSGHMNTVRQVGQVPNGRDLFTVGLDGAVRIWDRQRLTTRQVVQLAAQPGSGISVLAFSRDGQFLATGGKFGAAVWDASTGTRIVTFPCPAWVEDIAFGPDDGKLIASLSDQTIRIWPLNHLPDEASLASLWTESFTGTRISDAGEVEALRADEWRSAKRLIVP
jgi:WD40 repeat protein